MTLRLFSSFSILIFFTILLQSCLAVDEPHLQSFTPISIDKISTSEVALSGTAHYYNSNSFGGKIKEIYLNAYANDVHISDISKELDIDIKANSNFDVPIDINIPLKSILDKKSGFLGGLVNAITQQKVSLKYSGTVTVNFAKIEVSLPIDKEEELTISL